MYIYCPYFFKIAKKKKKQRERKELSTHSAIYSVRNIGYLYEKNCECKLLYGR